MSMISILTLILLLTLNDFTCDGTKIQNVPTSFRSIPTTTTTTKSSPIATNHYVIELLRDFPYNVNGNLIFSPLGIKMCLLALAVASDNREQKDTIGRMLFRNFSTPLSPPKTTETTTFTYTDETFFAEAHRVLSDLHQPFVKGNNGMETPVNMLRSQVLNEDNHNYIYSYVFMNQNLPITNSSVLTVLEQQLQLIAYRYNLDQLAEEKKKFHTYIREKMPTYRDPPALPAPQPELMNIIVFVREWAKEFSDTNEKLKFHTDQSGVVKKVPKLVVTTECNVGYSVKYQSLWVSIPYRDQRYRLVVIMPNGTLSLQQFINHFRPSDVDLYLGRLSNSHSKTIHLSMTSFKIEQELQLSSVLQQQGLFSLNMNHLSPELNNLHGIQLSLIEVTKKGTFAQSTTRFVSRSFFPIEPEAVVDIDRPFMFLLIGQISQWREEILFAGYVNDPFNHK